MQHDSLYPTLSWRAIKILSAEMLVFRLYLKKSHGAWLFHLCTIYRFITLRAFLSKLRDIVPNRKYATNWCRTVIFLSPLIPLLYKGFVVKGRKNTFFLRNGILKIIKKGIYCVIRHWKTLKTNQLMVRYVS